MTFWQSVKEDSSTDATFQMKMQISDVVAMSKVSIAVGIEGKSNCFQSKNEVMFRSRAKILNVYKLIKCLLL
jgi:hypothetical protein